MDSRNTIPLLKGFVRLVRQCGITAWTPYSRKDIDEIEAVQRRANNLIPNVRSLAYSDRLSYLKLSSITHSPNWTHDLCVQTSQRKNIKNINTAYHSTGGVQDSRPFYKTGKTSCRDTSEAAVLLSAGGRNLKCTAYSCGGDNQ